MTPAPEESIVLITSRNPENKGFGSGFIFAEKERYSYVATCWHVVADVGGPEQALVLGQPVKLFAKSWEDGPGDLAVLQVEGLLNRTPLLTNPSANKGMSFNAYGNEQNPEPQNPALRCLEGKLGKRTLLNNRSTHQQVEAWTLVIDEPDALQPGMCGGPVFHKERGDVFAVLSSLEPDGHRGQAISVKELDHILEGTKLDRTWAREDRTLGIRVCYAAPVDMFEELHVLENALSELIKKARSEKIELIFQAWQPPQAQAKEPQAQLEMGTDSQYWDIFIGILWNQFDPAESGETAPGTRQAFEQGLNALGQNIIGKAFIYRCKRPVAADELDLERWQDVKQFVKAHQLDGTRPGLPRWFDGVADFETKLLEDLKQLLLDFSKERASSIRDHAAAVQVNHLRGPVQAAPLRLPFVNRKQELASIAQDFTPPYHLVDAPAGYGKTMLLHELKERFEVVGWLAAYVSVQRHRTIGAVERCLAQELNVILPGAAPSSIQADNSLGRAILDQLGEKFGQADDKARGLILLIDIDKSPWETLLPTVDKIFQDLVPKIEFHLKQLEYFRERHSPFRVVFSGRFLAGSVPANTPFRLQAHKLTPFTYEVVRETVEVYLRQRFGVLPDFAEELSAYLMFYTGGHPSCIARVLELYLELNCPDVEQFFTAGADEIWHVVEQEVTELRVDIPRKLRQCFDEISIFRGLDYPTLKVLTEPYQCFGFEDYFLLADKLTTLYQMHWEERLLVDDITRRLLVLHLMRQVQPETFTAMCERARQICLAHLQEKDCQAPEKWAIHYLFQSLQKEMAEVHLAERRQELSNVFFLESVPLVLKHLFKNRDERSERHMLKQALQKDWEFQYLVNFYLRPGRYVNDDGQFNQLMQQIDQFVYDPDEPQEVI